MISLGISTASLYPMETEKALEELGKNGIKNTEIFFNASIELQKDFVRELKNIAEYYGVNIVSVHPTMSLAESFMLFSAYDRRTAEGLSQYKRYGEIAGELNAKYVIMHGGKPNGILNDFEYFERYLEIGEAVSSQGGILLQENVAKYRAGEIDFLVKMVEYLGDKAQLCLDIKQCIRNGYSPFEAMKKIGKNVRHLHVSDSNEAFDCMLPLKGKFDFSDFFELCRQMGYEGCALTEVYRTAYDSLGELFSSQRNFVAKIT